MGFSCGSVVLALVVGTCESWGPLHRLARRERLTSHVTKGPIITIPSATYDPRERYYTPENRPNVPEDYSAQQLTLNRIRECAVANKVELMRILRSGECFSRAGKKRMDGLVGQLVAPLRVQQRRVRRGLHVQLAQQREKGAREGAERQRVAQRAGEILSVAIVLRAE